MQDGSGRVQQKQRTRMALMQAVNEILARGEVPTIDGVAAEAMVSRATVYRYYSNIDALAADAFFSSTIPRPEDAFTSDETSPTDRALAVERITHELLLSDEIGMHLILREFVETWLANPDGERPPRPGRRMPLIDAAIAPYAETLGSEGTMRLRSALAMVIGLEALVSLREVCGLSIEEARKTARWAVTAIVERAFAEAAAKGESP